MTKPQEIQTPSLIEFVEEIVKYTKQGYRIRTCPQVLGWLYYCDMVQDDDSEMIAVKGDSPQPAAPAEAKPEAHKRGPKAKAKKEPVEA